MGFLSALSHDAQAERCAGKTLACRGAGFARIDQIRAAPGTAPPQI